MTTASADCLRLDIFWFLLTHTREAEYRNMFNDDLGQQLSPYAARKALLQELLQGHRYAPLCEHDNFDHAQGWCLGPRALEEGLDG